MEPAVRTLDELEVARCALQHSRLRAGSAGRNQELHSAAPGTLQSRYGPGRELRRRSNTPRSSEKAGELDCRHDPYLPAARSGRVCRIEGPESRPRHTDRSLAKTSRSCKELNDHQLQVGERKFPGAS